MLLGAAIYGALTMCQACWLSHVDMTILSLSRMKTWRDEEVCSVPHSCRWQSWDLNSVCLASALTQFCPLANEWGWGSRHQDLGLPSAGLSVFWPQAIMAGKVGNGQKKRASGGPSSRRHPFRGQLPPLCPHYPGPLGTFSS